MLRYLGYACLNTLLPDASPRGTILKYAALEKLRALIATNLAGLEAVLRFNVEHDIRMFRISSDIIPFGSHPVNKLHWWDEFAVQLAAIGSFIREHGMRVSMHPGQHTVLSALEPRVLDASIRDLEFHGRLLTAMGLNGEHKVVVHGGGAYGDLTAATQRWVSQAERLPESVRQHLVVENDERVFGAEDVLRLAQLSGLPMVFDVFHHRVKSCAATDAPDLLRAAAATWQPNHDGLPKIHFSSQAAGRRPGTHADYVDPDEFQAFLAQAPREIAFDCMLEAKAKEQALFTLRNGLALAA